MPHTPRGPAIRLVTVLTFICAIGGNTIVTFLCAAYAPTETSSHASAVMGHKFSRQEMFQNYALSATEKCEIIRLERDTDPGWRKTVVEGDLFEYRVRVSNGLGLTITSLSKSGVDFDNAGIGCITQTAKAGWPFRCVVARYWWATPGSQTRAIRTSGWYDCWRLSERLFPQHKNPAARVLPLRPLWLGLIANVTLWIAGIAAIIHLKMIWSRRTRRRMGQCESCGYPHGVSGLAVCPECGDGGRRPDLNSAFNAPPTDNER